MDAKKPTRVISRETRAIAAQLFIDASHKSRQPVPSWVKRMANKTTDEAPEGLSADEVDAELATVPPRRGNTFSRVSRHLLRRARRAPS